MTCEQGMIAENVDSTSRSHGATGNETALQVKNKRCDCYEMTKLVMESQAAVLNEVDALRREVAASKR